MAAVTVRTVRAVYRFRGLDRELEATLRPAELTTPNCRSSVAGSVVEDRRFDHWQSSGMTDVPHSDAELTAAALEVGHEIAGLTENCLVAMQNADNHRIVQAGMEAA